MAATVDIYGSRPSGSDRFADLTQPAELTAEPEAVPRIPVGEARELKRAADLQAFAEFFAAWRRERLS